ncbi:MAG TPA: tRNA (adenosine(37)-N6)-threonylcarbamoyltransferase complex dimerization subunit type 1 TsaB [Propionibacteriaceae bacterium]|jgi:tRNA threonylcarbamoyl adenosine modification protein YeaZ|nr:tRNA (adenosine(37)-N6)-threonylcarbamoyltransferase complex dimerization subunit type 1 TsaB [Propionibacteriaceae bacterium]
MTDRLVLALDTATVVNVGLARGTEVLAVATVPDRMAHAEQLMPLVAETLADADVRVADLDQIVVGLGPGPFTGLRVGVVTAQILATVTGVPLRGVCSLDVLAAEHAAAGPVEEFVVATDARRREVYWARYAADGSRRDGPAVDRPDAVPKLPVIGPAGDIYPGQLVVAPGPSRLDPGVMAVRGPYLPDAGREPLYLRRPDASEPSRPKSVLRAG